MNRNNSIEIKNFLYDLENLKSELLLRYSSKCSSDTPFSYNSDLHSDFSSIPHQFPELYSTLLETPKLKAHNCAAAATIECK